MDPKHHSLNRLTGKFLALEKARADWEKNTDAIATIEADLLRAPVLLAATKSSFRTALGIPSVRRIEVNTPTISLAPNQILDIAAGCGVPADRIVSVAKLDRFLLKFVQKQLG